MLCGQLSLELMDFEQEEALYEFLENVTEPFSLEEITSHIRSGGQKNSTSLYIEIAAYLHTRKIAFKIDNQNWLSRRGCFESVKFVISPSRLELLNGIFIPGHRCVPFANPLTLPNHYKFFWKGKIVPATTTEAPPEDLYPYYCIYGEEFAPQYIAKDNPENEKAFNSDIYEDPPEVSIHTLDMRGIYRESAFVPGDRFVVRTIDWKKCHFELEKIGKDEWLPQELDEWFKAAESGFEDSFAILGPGASTEEQIAFAYWYGGKRMREVPAYSLEEYLFEKTDHIETVPYGVETRYWYAGKEIPDIKNLQSSHYITDMTFVEELLFNKNIIVSEFVLLSYVRDAFFRNEKEIDQVINRIVPPLIHLEEAEWDVIADYVSDSMEDLQKRYSLFLDKSAGPVRQRAAELHTAVIELAARLQKGEIESAWLPRHTFIILSQIQGHAAALLEDLAFNETIPESEILAMDNSLDSMVDTFSDIKELINNARDNFRRSNMTVIHGGKQSGQLWRMMQISITGLDIWRRAIISHECTLAQLHKLIQIGFNWKGSLSFRFYNENADGSRQYLHDTVKLGDINFHGKRELIYEYGREWNVKVIIMSSYQPSTDETARFAAGNGAAPPESAGGARHFSKLLASLENGSNAERQSALRELGADFVPDHFDLEKTNENLRAAWK